MYDQTIAAQTALRVGAQRWLTVLWEITRLDGVKHRLTALDRSLRAFGELWTAGVLGAIGVSHRRAGLQPVAVDCAGVIDGTIITLPAIKGGRYRGAKVREFKVDWRQPLLVYDEEVYTIVSTVDDGAGMFVGRLESGLNKLQQNAGGPWGGIIGPDCTFKYGGIYCRKDISAETYAAVQVDTVDAGRPRYKAAMVVGTWPAGSPAHTEATYRGGSVTWTTGNNAGSSQEIKRYTHSTRAIELLIPAPFAMQPGDQCTVKPGCGGLESDCKARNNFDNFGGVRNMVNVRDVINPDAVGGTG